MNFTSKEINLILKNLDILQELISTDLVDDETIKQVGTYSNKDAVNTYELIKKIYKNQKENLYK
tara:strand:+ start:1125 stop:1316 length:192 start_codon:yes stop_codon:yes gene_type:complete